MEMVEEGRHQPTVTPKRIKVEEILDEEGEDRISELPDGVLIEILSRLPSAEHAIRTGTLSKRWNYLWTSVPILIFNRNAEHQPLSDFVSFVDKTLTQCHPSKLRKFAIDTDYEYDSQFEPQIDNWIRHALNCNVEELDLSLYSCDTESDLLTAVFRLNDDFFINSCFTHLRLRGCILEPTGKISWNRLRSLFLCCGYLDEDLIDNILSGCPSLETLKFFESYGTWRFNITSKSIKKLGFCTYMDPDYAFESRVNNWIRYAIKSNVEELDLNFHQGDYKAEAEFMLNEDLFINSSLIDLKLAYCIFNPMGLIGWKKLKSLYIECGDLDENVIENILRGSPLLETLVLQDCYGYRRVDITSTSVEKLVFSRCCDRGGEFELADVIEINAPHILSLTIQGFLHLLKLSFSNLSSLVEANLDISTAELRDETTLEEDEMLKGFIQSVCHAKELKIGDYYCKEKLEKYKHAMLYKYELNRDPKSMLMGLSGNCNTSRTYVGSISEEVQQFEEDLKMMKLEQAKREAARKAWLVMLDAEWEQLKEKIQKIKYEQAERVMQEVEWAQLNSEIEKMICEHARQKAEWAVQEAEWEAQTKAKFKEMEDKLKAW